MRMDRFSVVFAIISSVMILAALPAAAASATLFPPSAADNICPDTPLRVVFSKAPTLTGAGKIQIFDAATNAPVETIDTSSPTSTQTIGGLPNFKYYPVIITGNQAVIYPHNHALDYGKTYYVTIEASVFKTASAAFAGISNSTDWRFTTKTAPPPAGTTRLTIAADGTGDFCTIQAAIDFLPKANTTPTTLFIRNGTYNELIYINDRYALTFLGEDRKQTVIAYANNAKFNPANDQGTYHRGVFLASKCDHLTLANLTIRNTTPQGGSQAEAIILNGTPRSQAVLTDVDLYSFQDTLQINGQAYINDCAIEGDVDFMWGTGPCYFENCRCRALRSKAYYTQIRNTESNHGYVYHHCTFDGSPGITGMYLSRIAPAAYPFSEVVLIDCTLGAAVGDAGWHLDAKKGAATQEVVGAAEHVHFWEFNSHDADGKPIDTSHRLPISRQLKDPDDAALIKDYSNPTFVLGNDWIPQLRATRATQPGN